MVYALTMNSKFRMRKKYINLLSNRKIWKENGCYSKGIYVYINVMHLLRIA